jgi:hypothetical protein
MVVMDSSLSLITLFPELLALLVEKTVEVSLELHLRMVVLDLTHQTAREALTMVYVIQGAAAVEDFLL